MELRRYLDFLWRRWLLIIITTAVTIAVAVVGSNYIQPVYQASTTLRIAISAGGPLEYSDYMVADRLMNTYVEIATSRPVSDELVQTLKLAKAPVLKAEIIPNTELIRITVEDASPKQAAKIANTLAGILMAQSSQIYVGGGRQLTDVLAEQLTQVQADLQKTQDDYEKLLVRTPVPPEIDAARQILTLKQTNYATLLSQYEQARFREKIQASMITVWETAEVPKKPARPNMLLNMLLGLVAGLAGGFGLGLALENLDTTLYTTTEIERVTNLPVMGRIPKASRREISRLEGEYSPLVEAFRNLATMILQNENQQETRTILVMSAQPDQGKSTVVMHLAATLSEFGRNVVVVDCDTRLPRLHHLFQLNNRCGLKDVLENKTDLESAIQKSSHAGVDVLTSGSSLAHPSHVLGSPQMARLIEQLEKTYDHVLLDSPAFLAAADVAALVPNAKSLILVVRRSHARREALDVVLRFLQKLEATPIALVVTQAESQKGYGYYQYRKRSEFLASQLRRVLPGHKKATQEPGAVHKQQGAHAAQK